MLSCLDFSNDVIVLDSNVVTTFLKITRQKRRRRNPLCFLKKRENGIISHHRNTIRVPISLIRTALCSLLSIRRIIIDHPMYKDLDTFYILYLHPTLILLYIYYSGWHIRIYLSIYLSIYIRERKEEKKREKKLTLFAQAIIA
jgi:hypothetical protein